MVSSEVLTSVGGQEPFDQSSFERVLSRLRRCDLLLEVAYVLQVVYLHAVASAFLCRALNEYDLHMSLLRTVELKTDLRAHGQKQIERTIEIVQNKC